MTIQEYEVAEWEKEFSKKFCVLDEWVDSKNWDAVFSPRVKEEVRAELKEVFTRLLTEERDKAEERVREKLAGMYKLKSEAKDEHALLYGGVYNQALDDVLATLSTEAKTEEE